MRFNILLTFTAVYILCAKSPGFPQQKEGELTIRAVQKGIKEPAVWIQIQTAADDNLGGWYQNRGVKGFPASSPVKIKVPPGEVTVTAWNHNSEPVVRTFTVSGGKPVKGSIELVTRFDLHREGYFSFDSHNHLNGYDEKNRPPYIYPYCAALGIDHLDIGQGWLFGLRMPASYDSIVTYLARHSTSRLNLRFGAEAPKLRYGHTWYINHPGMKDPLGSYLDWHDAPYFEAIKGDSSSDNGTINLKDALHPHWRPPFVDRLLARKKGAVAFAAHPTRWWHTGENEIYPATNVSADLAFDMLAAQSYDGMVVAGDTKDHIFYQNLWFNLLNRGHRLIPAAESDGSISRGNLGLNFLTYAWTGNEKYDLDELIAHVKNGHTMVSSRAAMLLTLDDDLPPGTVLPADGKNHTIKVKVFSEPDPQEYVSYLVLYRNGRVKEIVDLRNPKRREITHTFVVSEKETAWYLVKSYGKEYPQDSLQFDVMSYAEAMISDPGIELRRNTGLSLTAPIYFNGPGWKAPEPVVSKIRCRLLDKRGQPLKRHPVQIWNIDEKLADKVTDDEGVFHFEAPATIDVRFTLPDGQQEQQWLFYEYPPLVEIIEDIYTISWANQYPGLNGSQMPWEAFRYDEIKETLREIDWTIRPNGKIMKPGPLF